MTTKKLARTLLRKGKLTIDKVPDGDKYNIIQEYKRGTKVGDIAEKYRITEEAAKGFIHREYQDFLNARETRTLVMGNTKFNNLKKPKDINTEFMRLIEDDSAELVYAWYYGTTGDNLLSLKKSGLSVGILKPKGKDDESVRTAYRLRGIYLRTLPQVNKEIQRVREDRLRDDPVTKGYIQSELVDQIHSMKELAVDDPRKRTNLLKAIDMLGKTIGAYTTRIEVKDVDPSSALDTLIEMSKEPSTSSTYTEVIDTEG